MNNISFNLNAHFTKYIVSKTLLNGKELIILDVGASGGIHEVWNSFGDCLKAFGFDPLVHECERLNRFKSSDKIIYLPYFISESGQKKSECFERERLFLKTYQARFSNFRANEQLQFDFNLEFNFQNPDVILSKESISLDEFCEGRLDYVDFIKIDTDGQDFSALKGANRLFDKGHVLGVMIEAPFNGYIHHEANIFCNIDNYMRRKGFTLYDLSLNRISRADLPAKFTQDFPSPTQAGQVVWGDALYFRDGGDLEYEETWSRHFSDIDLLKLACLFEIFGLMDCTAELLKKRRKQLSKLINIEDALNMLTSPLDGRRLTYSEYNHLFDHQLEVFFPEKSPHYLDGISHQNYLRIKSDLKKFHWSVIHHGLMDSKIDEELKVMFFGAGRRFEFFSPIIRNALSTGIFLGIIDNDKMKWGLSRNGLEIFGPTEIIMKNPDLVVVTSFYYDEIIFQLETIKKKNNLSFEIAYI